MKIKKLLAGILSVSLVLSSAVVSVSAETEQEPSDSSLFNWYPEATIAVLTGEGTDTDKPVGSWEPYEFITELDKLVGEFISENTDKGSVFRGPDFDLNNPENSKLQITAAEEQIKEEIENYLTEIGYDKDILNVTVDENLLTDPIIPGLGADTSDFENILTDIDADFTFDIFDGIFDGNGIWNGEEFDINNLPEELEPYKFIFELQSDILSFLEDNKDLDCRETNTELDPENPESSILSAIVGDEKTKKCIEEYVASLGFSKDILDINVDEAILQAVQILFGDINSDGKVDITDLSELSLAIIGDTTLNEEQIEAADIDADGKANLSDLARLRQFLSKVITSLR